MRTAEQLSPAELAVVTLSRKLGWQELGGRYYAVPMRQLSFKRHRFPPEVIRHSIWLYARLTLSLRDVEEMLAAGQSH